MTETPAETASFELDDALEATVNAYRRDVEQSNAVAIRRILFALVEVLEASGCSYRELAAELERAAQRAKRDAEIEGEEPEGDKDEEGDE